MDQKLNMNMENNGMMEVKEYDVSTNAYAEWKAQQGKVAHIRYECFVRDTWGEVVQIRVFCMQTRGVGEYRYEYFARKHLVWVSADVRKFVHLPPCE